MSDDENKGGRLLPSPDDEFVIEKVTSDKPATIGRTDNKQKPMQFSFPDFQPLSELPAWFIEKMTKTTSAIVGRDIEADSLVRIGEQERCGGLYVLGQPRTGKSNLLISLALADIQNGHGILFIDPHTDAINDLVSRIPESRREDIILLDPTDKSRSFGINPLHCTDPADPIELDNTVGRVLDIFAKVWGDPATGRLGIWLEKILANSVYLLLENQDPGYTLVDIPALLWEDTTFRNELLRRVKVKSSVPDFWLNDFDRLTRRDKTEQVGPALSRLDIFRRNDMVRDIVGQQKPTVDFSEILKEKKIVLLRMPVNLAGEVKNLIGTMLLSDVLYAVFERAELAEGDRPFFGIYCDEFQEFATPDFARLFTQTGKYKVMPVVAHQTRLGQFRQGDPNHGATLDSPNKVLFALSSYDARELALDFAREPPTEIRLEEQYVISQNPVPDLLLRAHKDPDIRAFVTKYLRYLDDKRDDIKAEMEGEKFARMLALDTAAIYGAEAQGEGIVGGSHYAAQLEDVNARRSALARAGMQSSKLIALHKQGNRLRVTMRQLNRFLTEVMEGEKRAGQEAFSDFLISLAAGYSALPEEFAATLGLYIEVSYGDPNNARDIPFTFAKKYGPFQAVASQVLKQAEVRRKEEEDKRYKMYIARWEEDRNIRESIRRGRARELWPRLMNYRLRFNNGWYTLEDELLKPFLLMCARPSVQKKLTPYLTTRFAGAWKEAYEKWSAAIPGDVLERLEYLRNDDGRDDYNSPYSSRDKVHFSVAFLDSFRAFFQKYKEGGVVALALANTARYPKWCTWDLDGMMGEDGYYPGFNVLYLPVIENRKPWEVLLFLEELTEALSGFNVETECAKFYELAAGTNPYQRKQREMRDGHEFYTDLDNLVKFVPPAGELTRLIEDREVLKEIKEVIGLNVWREHLDIGRNKWWDRSTSLIKAYLMARACDIVRFGKEVADVAFPQPDVNGATTKQVTEFVASLVEMVKHKEKYREWPKYLPQLVVPEHLDARVLDAVQRLIVRDACIKEIKRGPQVVNKVAGTIDEFAKFCKLLAQPENHIKVRSGQYVEKLVPLRLESDMVNEMARVLTGLPRYTAYARIVEEKGGEAIVWKGKIRTEKLTDAPAEGADAARGAIEKNALRYCRPRSLIQEEIRARQERWRPRVRVEEPSVHTQETKKLDLPSEPGVSEPDAPPPTSVSVKKAGGKPEKREKQTADAQRVLQDAGIPESFTFEKPAMGETDESPKARLVYRGDFTKPTGWDEEHSEHVSLVRYDGFYHIAVFRPAQFEWYYAYFYPSISMERNFLAKVDVAIHGQSGNKSTCGLAFNIHGETNEKLCSFFVCSTGHFCLRSYSGKHAETLSGAEESEYIHRGEKPNTVMVMREGERLTLAVNGHAVAKPTCSVLTAGKIGLFVGSNAPDLYAEARFNNFALYALL